jgi:hypothetical protein
LAHRFAGLGPQPSSPRAAQVGGLLELSFDFFDHDILDPSALDRPDREAVGRVLNNLREMLLVVLHHVD